MDDGGWVDLSLVKERLTRWKPDFDVRSYGFPSFKTLVGSEPRLFEFVTHVGLNVRVRLVGGGAEAGAALAEGGAEEGGRAAQLEHRPLTLIDEGGDGKSSDSSAWKRSDAQEHMMRSVCDAGGLDSPEQRKAWLPTFSRMPDADGVPVIYMP